MLAGDAGDGDAARTAAAPAATALAAPAAATRQETRQDTTQVLPVAVGAAVTGRVLTGAGTPVPQAAITLIDPTGRQLGRATADPQGRFAVDAPRSGSYVLVGSAPGHQPQVATLAVGESPLEYDLVLAGTAGLRGRVLSEGKPVVGALVVATDPRGEVSGSTLTDADGGYVFGDLVAGEYVLTVSGNGSRPTAASVRVGDGGPTEQDVVLDPAAAVRGTVRRLDGRPLADARVALLDPAGNVVGVHTTGDDGEYAFSDLPGTDYTVVASGYPPVATPVRLDGGGQEGFDLSLGHEQEG
ncbi:MSCRAMM family protein [Phaeacidiphilus oryzae]|uniref:MSCRAMM family protein n=1 Tax=Phaeacidiphilus oryzae TaxID=348818 RepID=UPI001F329188|nr:carboxypeptidase-like regulatory domain-containing protein [Phaeacidiphilus oryzae]